MARSASPALLARVASGDPEAVRACVERFGPLVWSLARRMLADRGQAEDAVQEVFIELWRSAERYDPALASEPGFVAMVARRRLIDVRRRLGRQPGTEALDEQRFAREDSGLARVELCDEAERAARALERLRPEERRVLELSIGEGWSHNEIARATKMPLGTVKSHIRRGLERVALLVRGRGRAAGSDPLAEVSP